MESFGEVEADFQQYYHLDVSKLGFWRYARLLLNLPPESRFVQKYTDAKDWSWDKEVDSRILAKLDEISCLITNLFRKKGTKARQPEEQFQPKYVKRAKERAVEQQKDDNRRLNAELKEFFEEKNSMVTKPEERDGKESRTILR